MSTATGQATRIKKAFFMQYNVAINIDASPDKIWTYLTTGSDYPRWNSTVDRIEGMIAPGQKIKVFAKISPERAFPVEVAEFSPPRKMVWRGGMPLGLFKGVRTFLLTPESNGSTTVTMTEEFRGAMLPMMAGSMPDLRPAFEGFAADLKAAAEG